MALWLTTATFGDDLAAVRQGIVELPGANAVRLYSLRVVGGSPECAALFQSRADGRADDRWELNRQHRVDGKWSTLKSMSSLRLPIRVALGGDGGFGIIVEDDRRVTFAYTAAIGRGSAGILPWMEEPFLTLGWAPLEPNSPKDLYRFPDDMRVYGGIRLAWVCEVRPGQWLLLSREGHVFEAAVGQQATPTTKAGQKSLPAFSGGGIWARMVGHMVGVPKLRPVPAQREQKGYTLDANVWHGCGWPKEGVVPVLCAFPSKEAGAGWSVRIYTVQLAPEGKLVSRQVDEPKMPGGLPAPFVLATGKSHEGEVWWCHVTHGRDVTKAVLGHYKGIGAVRWVTRSMEGPGRVVGGCVDGEGNLSLVREIVTDKKVRVVEEFFGKTE